MITTFAFLIAQLGFALLMEVVDDALFPDVTREHETNISAQRESSVNVIRVDVCLYWNKLKSSISLTHVATNRQPRRR